MEDARLAVLEDVERVEQLCRLGRDELRGQRGGDLFVRRESPSPLVRPDLLTRLASPDHVVWVGTLDAQVVGYGLGRIEHLGATLVHGVVEDLYVEPGARSVGVGQVVMEGLVRWFVGRGCAGVDAVALPGDRQVKSFLESSGFKARLIVLYRSLNS
jgi:GNAT superfamily N-acetyltransferase